MKKVLFAIFWTVFSFIAARYIVGAPLALLLGENFSSPFWVAIYQILFYLVAVFLVVFVPWKIFKKFPTNRTELGLKNLPTWSDIGLSIVGFLVYLIAAGFFVNLLSNLPFFDADAVQETGYGAYVLGFNRFMAFLALVIAAPIGEEIIFRGWLYGKLRAKINNKFSLLISILIVSIIFALFHGQLNVMANVFVMSIVLCLMRETTGTIYSGILLHIIKNAVAFYLVYVMV